MSSSDVIEIVFTSILTVTVLILTILYAVKYVVVVKHQTAVIVERNGRFHKVLAPGIHFLVPIVDVTPHFKFRQLSIFYNDILDQEFTKRKVNVHNTDGREIFLNESIIELPYQPAVTRDNVPIDIHFYIFYRISNPILAMYETADLYHTVSLLASTTVRSIVGQLTLDDILASREEICAQTKSNIFIICQNWGLEIIDVDILGMRPPFIIIKNMEEQLMAERQRRTSIIVADGRRQRAIIKAEGSARCQLLNEQGKAQAQLVVSQAQASMKQTLAEAQSEALKLLSAAVKGKDAGQYNLGLLWLKAVEKVIDNSKQVDVAIGLPELSQIAAVV